MMFYMLLYYCTLFCIDVFCSWEKKNKKILYYHTSKKKKRGKIPWLPDRASYGQGRWRHFRLRMRTRSLKVAPPQIRLELSPYTTCIHTYIQVLKYHSPMKNVFVIATNKHVTVINSKHYHMYNTTWNPYENKCIHSHITVRTMLLYSALVFNIIHNILDQ